MGALHVLFSWPNGGIWSNMVAWVICGGIGILWGRAKFITWNREREERDNIRHELLKTHIDNHMAKLRKQIKEK